MVVGEIGDFFVSLAGGGVAGGDHDADRQVRRAVQRDPERAPVAVHGLHPLHLFEVHDVAAAVAEIHPFFVQAETQQLVDVLLQACLIILNGQLLRFRLNEEGMNFRYGGSDIVDLKQVEWVEVVDRDRRTFRIALDSSTHLPISVVVTTCNANTRERDVEIYNLLTYQYESRVLT